PVAVAVVRAADAVLVGSRIDSGRPGERMPPEHSRGAGHHLGESRASQWRHRVLVLARALEDVALRVDLSIEIAGLARNTNLVFNESVIGFELLQTERPVFDRRSAGDSRSAVAFGRLAGHLEVPGTQTPALRPVVERRPSHGVHHWVDG